MDRNADMRGITDVYRLRSAYNTKHPHSHFFDQDTLNFFGETMSTMRLLKGTAKVKDVMGEEHTCYVLSSLQRKHPCGPRRHYAYFDIETLDEV